MYAEYNSRYHSSMMGGSVIMALVWGYFALRIDHDPESCVASTKDDYFYSDGDDTTMDVGATWRYIEEIVFYGYVATILLATLSHQTSSYDFNRLLAILGQIVQLVIAFYSGWAIYIRSQPSGRFCAGDSLNIEKESDDLPKAQGLFFFVLLWLFYIGVFFCLFSVVCAFIAGLTRK